MGRAPWIIWCASLLLVLVLPWWLSPGPRLPWTLQNIGGSLWPLGLAFIAALIAVRVWRRVGRPAIPEIPQGDLLLPVERLLVVVRNVALLISERISLVYTMLGRVAEAERVRAWKFIRHTGRVEALLERWEVAMFLGVLLGVAFAVVAMR